MGHEIGQRELNHFYKPTTVIKILISKLENNSKVARVTTQKEQQKSGTISNENELGKEKYNSVLHIFRLSGNGIYDLIKIEIIIHVSHTCFRKSLWANDVKQENN